MDCCNCKMLKIIEDEHCRIYHVCTYSQSSCFLQEVGYCSECDLEDDEIVGYDDRTGAVRAMEQES